MLIRAFQRVKSSVPDAELIIGGKTNKDQPLLEALSRELGVQDITFKGFIPEEELATYYATTTLMVFPSRYGFGLSVLEAMACGTPVVAAAALDAPEFVADAGLLVEPDSPPAVARAIDALLADPALRKRLGAAARDAALRRFSADAIVPRYEADYERCLAAQPRPAP